MEAVLYFLFWAGAILLMMRFGCGSHVMGHGHPKGNHGSNNSKGSDLSWIPPETDKDPVCGMAVHTITSKSAVHDGHVFYFCSRECRERFEAAPETYLSESNSVRSNDKEQSHA